VADLFVGHLKPWAAFGLLVLFVGRSRMALRQMEAFASRRLDVVFLSGGAFLLLVLGVAQLKLHLSMSLIVLGSGLALIATLARAGHNPRPGPGPHFLPFWAWARGVAHDPKPRTLLSLAFLRIPGSKRRWAGFYELLAARLPASSLLCRVSEDRLLVAAPEGFALDREDLWRLWGGLLRDERRVSGPSGSVALETAFNERALGSIYQPELMSERPSLQSVKDFFGEKFPNGRILDLGLAADRKVLASWDVGARRDFTGALLRDLEGRTLRGKSPLGLRWSFAHEPGRRAPWAFIVEGEADAASWEGFKKLLKACDFSLQTQP